MKYDYLIVGAGFFGATCARELSDAGKRVLVVERAPHIGGMAHDALRDGVLCSSHGGHVFHTRDRRLWDYVQRFGEWRQFHAIVKAQVGERAYTLPINLETFQQVYGGVMSPARARTILAEVCTNGNDAANVRDWCLANIGPDLYALLIEGYTRKQWGKDPAEVPASVVRRLPVRLNWNTGYFDDPYQGVPVEGFTALIGNMLERCKVLLGEDYLSRCIYWDSLAARTIYTGPLDALWGYQLGRLQYRSLRFEWETLPVADYQGCCSVNYSDVAVPYTRCTEFKHFWPANVPHTVIAREYPTSDGAPLYPVNDERNAALYDGYRRLTAGLKPNLRIGGRLGGYKYLDMQQAIGAAQRLVAQELS